MAAVTVRRVHCELQPETLVAASCSFLCPLNQNASAFRSALERTDGRGESRGAGLRVGVHSHGRCSTRLVQTQVGDSSPHCLNREVRAGAHEVTFLVSSQASVLLVGGAPLAAQDWSVCLMRACPVSVSACDHGGNHPATRRHHQAEDKRSGQ